MINRGQSLNNYDFIDLHFHINPDLYIRRFDELEASQEYRKLNGAFLSHNHLGFVQTSKENIFDSCILNNIFGGLNYKSIQNILKNREYKLTKFLVIFPTITGRNHKSKLSRNVREGINEMKAFKPETVSDEIKLYSKTIDVIKFCKENDLCLATGHASKKEVYSILEACYKLSFHNILVTQFSNPQTGILADEALQISKFFPFAYFEQTALTLLLEYETKENFFSVIKELPNLIYSSDLGQTSQMDPKEWIVFSRNLFQEAGILSKRISQITKQNPINFISL